MSKKLELIFKTEDGVNKTITITNPREDVTKVEADAVMATVIDKNVFTSNGGALTEAYEAHYRSTEIEVLQ